MLSRSTTFGQAAFRYFLQFTWTGSSPVLLQSSYNSCSSDVPALQFLCLNGKCSSLLTTFITNLFNYFLEFSWTYTLLHHESHQNQIQPRFYPNQIAQQKKTFKLFQQFSSSEEVRVQTDRGEIIDSYSISYFQPNEILLQYRLYLVLLLILIF